MRDEYRRHDDGNRMFGVLQINEEAAGRPVRIGLRNSHDKSFRSL